ncbi:MAG: hypothetical protein ROY99_14620 [Ignavibacterium sp.]|nr:hypothetical protein [Ignavibacterium sp.]
MKNDNDTKPNPIELEELRTKLFENILSATSHFRKVELYTAYFNSILNLQSERICEAFLKEFIEEFLSSVKKFEVCGTDPAYTEHLVLILTSLENFNCFSPELSTIVFEKNRINTQLSLLNNVLKGEENPTPNEHKAYFPLIDKESSTEFYGILDSVTIRINKSTDADKLIIVPSETDLEKRIETQVNTSWKLALDLSKKYLKKLYKHHEVIISFDKRLGFYEGNSLGIALTVSFLEQLLKFYNPVYVINIKEQTAFTGGVDNKGKILTTGEEIIKQKVKVLFYSEIKNFVIPKCEETYAYFALTQLQKDYPKRKLKIISVEAFTDVINRRDLVDINKQKVIVRTGKFVKKNWAAVSAILILSAIISFFVIRDIDTNPSFFSSDGRKIYIKNKSGKILWDKNIGVPEHLLRQENHLKSLTMIVDINSDGVNEVITAREISKDISDPYIKCYDYAGNLIWKYSFKDEVVSELEELNTEYSSLLCDTFTVNGEKSLFLISNNLNSFSSAISRISLLDGRRQPGTFWASGHIMGAFIKDIDSDSKPEIVGFGYDNGFEDIVFFVYEIDSLTKVRPTTEKYLIRNYPVADMKSYIRFPKTDYEIYHQVRTPSPWNGGFSDEEESHKYAFTFANVKNNSEPTIGFRIDYNFKDIDIVIISSYRVQRDTLVAHGVLKPPYTDTKEYCNLIKSKLLFYKNEKWVKREELE